MTTISIEEHITQVHNTMDWRTRVQQKFGGDHLAAELLWGAAAHVTIALALTRNWHYDSHGAMRNVARQLAVERNYPQIQSDFAAAEHLHRHFYHGHLNFQQLNRYTRDAQRYIGKLQDLLHQA